MNWKVIKKEADYKNWLATQTPEYFTLFPDKNPNKKPEIADSTKKPSLAQVMPDKK